MLLANEDYLRVLAKSLRDEILPELTTDSGRATLITAVEALQDLIKREHNLPAIITAIAPEGIDLLNRIADLVDRPRHEEPLPADPKGFAALINQIDEGVRLLLGRPVDRSAKQVSALLRDVAHWEERYYLAFGESTLLPEAATEERPDLLTADTLAAALQSRLHKDIVVKDVETVPGGFVHQTLFFTLERAGHADQKLVVRKKSAHPILNFWGGLLKDEYQIVSTLHERGLPVAQPLWLFEDRPDVAGAFYVMTRGAGRSAGSLRDAYSGGQQFSEALMLSLAEFLGRLHSIPLETFADYLRTGDTRVQLGDTVTEATSKNVADIFDLWHRRQRLAVPSEAYMLDWLRRNIPEDDSRPVLVHGDCFVHNLIVDENDCIQLVADWETAHIGSPVTDLAYIKDQVVKYIDWQKFVSRYRDAGGPTVNEAHLPYYNALLNYRNSWGSNIAVARIKDGFQDIRMLPLSSEYFTGFLHGSIESMSKNEG